MAGHERFGQMTRVYYKYAIAAIIGNSTLLRVVFKVIYADLFRLVFDLSRPATFEAVAKVLLFDLCVDPRTSFLILRSFLISGEKT